MFLPTAIATIYSKGMSPRLNLRPLLEICFDLIPVAVFPFLRFAAIGWFIGKAAA